MAHDTGMPYITSHDDTKLFYKDWGTGFQTVLFVNGSNIHSDFWESHLVQLADRGLRAIAYDQRGHGRSDQPGHGFEFDWLADDLASLIDRLNLRDVTLVGYSNGAGVVARYLSRHGSSRIARTVLIAPTTPCIVRLPDNPDGFDSDYWESIISATIADRPTYYRSFVDSFFGKPVSPEVESHMLAMANGIPLISTIGINRALATEDFRPDMPAFTMPTLIVQGEKDATPLELTAIKTANAIPGSILKVYEGAAHALPITDKSRLLEDLLEFVGQERAAKAVPSS
jgi:non-heme chloroperoxidase